MYCVYFIFQRPLRFCTDACKGARVLSEMYKCPFTGAVCGYTRMHALWRIDRHVYICIRVSECVYMHECCMCVHTDAYMHLVCDCLESDRIAAWACEQNEVTLLPKGTSLSSKFSNAPVWLSVSFSLNGILSEQRR